VDSGIRLTHEEFGGRAVFNSNYWTNGTDNGDCYGHGTNVAALVGGKTYGVAKEVTLHDVAILNCQGEGTSNSILAGLNYFSQTATLPRPAIINLSVAGGLSSSVDSATMALTSTTVVIVAAGNSYVDACTVSPAGVQGVIAVGATNSSDYMAYFSNYGTCVDLYAPGQAVLSAWNRSDTDAAIASGTSQAAPLVSGVAALIIQNMSLPITVSSLSIETFLNANATNGVLLGLGPSSSNRLLYQSYQWGQEEGSQATSLILSLPTVILSLLVSLFLYSGFL